MLYGVPLEHYCRQHRCFNNNTTTRMNVSFRPVLAGSAQINDWSKQYNSIGPNNPNIDMRALKPDLCNRRSSYLPALTSNSSECTQWTAGGIDSKIDTLAASRLIPPQSRWSIQNSHRTIAQWRLLSLCCLLFFHSSDVSHLEYSGCN